MPDIRIEYVGRHHYGIFIDGELFREYETFDAAADAFEDMGGTFREDAGAGIDTVA